MNRLFRLLSAACFAAATAGAQEGAVRILDTLPLYPDGAPGAVGTGEDHTPSITPYLPAADKATGAAIIVCPGGGYGGLAMDHEGDQIGKWLAGEGIAAFITVYRHAPNYGHPTPRNDAWRAIRTVRSRAAEWGVDPSRIGILGFSAGGHLSATCATQWADADSAAVDAVERVSSRPDFACLLYPVITFNPPYAHMGSRKNLLGEDAPQALVDEMSADLRVTENTPPIFLVHTTEDAGVPPQNSVLFYLACAEKGVPVEMHIFEKGRHGLGLGGENKAFSAWPSLFIEWLRTREVVK